MAYKYNPRVSEREKRKITVWNGGIDDNGVILYIKNLNYTNIDDLAKKLNMLSCLINIIGIISLLVFNFHTLYG